MPLRVRRYRGHYEGTQYNVSEPIEESVRSVSAATRPGRDAELTIDRYTTSPSTMRLPRPPKRSFDGIHTSSLQEHRRKLKPNICEQRVTDCSDAFHDAAGDSNIGHERHIA